MSGPKELIRRVHHASRTPARRRAVRIYRRSAWEDAFRLAATGRASPEPGRHETTYERSREFDVGHVGAAGLHHIADVIRKRYHQGSVLTFEALPASSPRADAVELEVPGADVRYLYDALVANPEARDRLGGGSVTAGGRLILVAARTDLGLARRFAATLVPGRAPTVGYGAEEFVG